MANVHQKAEPITEDQLRAFANALSGMSQVLTEAADVAATQEPKALAIYNWASAQTGRKRLKAFVDDAMEALQLAQLGTPRDPGQLKARSTVRERNDARIAKSQERAKKMLKEGREAKKKEE